MYYLFQLAVESELSVVYYIQAPVEMLQIICEACRWRKSQGHVAGAAARHPLHERRKRLPRLEVTSTKSQLRNK